MIPPCDFREKCWRLGQIDELHAYAHWLKWTPHHCQKKIVLGLDKCTTVVAGRRFGKSELCGAIATYQALTNPDFKIYVIAPTQDQAKIIFGTIKKFCVSSPMIKDYVVATKDFPFPTITLSNGSEIHARSVGDSGEYLRGFKADLIILDEAELIKDDIINTKINPLRADVFAPIIKIGTPMGRSSHFYADFMFGQNKTPGYSSFHFTSYDNPHISHEFLDIQKTKISELQFQVEYMAEFMDDSVCVFKWESIERCLDDIKESVSPHKGGEYYMGVDLAKKHDNTVISIISQEKDGMSRLVYTEKWFNQPYSFIIERIESLAVTFGCVKINVDATGVGEGIVEQLQVKLPQVEGFTFSNASKTSVINSLKTGFEQGRLRISRFNEDLLQELKFYEYELSDSGTIKMNAPSGRHDDFVISLALCFKDLFSSNFTSKVTYLPQPKSKDLNSSETSVSLIDNIKSPDTDKFDFRDRIGIWE